MTVSLPAWPSGTASSTTCGSNLAAGNSCTITITPGDTATSDGSNPCSNGTEPIPGVVQVTANNASPVSIDVVVLNYGCIYQSGYVFAFDDTLPITESVGGKVAALHDATGSPMVWDSSSGCNSTDVACLITGANSLIQGDNSTTPAPGGNTYIINTIFGALSPSSKQEHLRSRTL